MASARTNSLMSKLDVETRRAIERDLVEQPPGRETYEKVYEHYRLADYGVSVKALERYGGYLRMLARNRWIGELADVAACRELGPDIKGLIRARLFEALTVDGETRIGELLKAAIAEKSLSDAAIRVEQWQQKRKAALEAVTVAEKTADPEEGRRKLASEIRAIYGLEG